ncbi:Cytochrome c1 heme lyase [Friedmanniomyces endolithicus]|uniref:Holocytochrome c-type synthase n=1 Tax=Friedmanniomyces endolithicus TaxID=329885 RepID=A0AAN6KD70_9PEZI|nr:Cytochrome c1 heme lyase [Friedmanniomyces endolithicus]KAK0792709.1 Cytochrome c1 heme lyase [Friedmanniomyces endolithicus]KAK0801789.1 Cytochrome c1 heme lyase [Friedmanniomyces endolithicus]KAK0858701.1 Cytochrome c1 heme lyase [Friedmanniomyces endolithicus]KAK0876457.1 Cytochrome c1 heme lyase [Friedmanniomyces endolithicus]
MPPEGADAADKCPVDPSTRLKWLEVAKARGQQAPAHPSRNAPTPTPRLPAHARFSLDTLSWQPPTSSYSPPRQSPSSRSASYRLSTDREISTIPRAHTISPDRPLHHAERAALSPPGEAPSSHASPANSELDTGHDKESGNWVYPSQEMFFAAMKRKGHTAEPTDMSTVIPIHNAVNEKAWAEIRDWEKEYSAACGGPKLVSFAGDSKALTPRARWKGWMGYTVPFDRHDWVVDRCGKKVEYVIDFYSGKGNGDGKGLNFYLDVRPKMNSWEGLKTRMGRMVGI